MQSRERQDDLRKTDRQRSSVRVLYFNDGQPRAVDAECENISPYGLFVKTRRRGPDAGTPVSLLLSFEHLPSELMVEGVVRWQGAVRSLADGTEGAGMGIEFVNLSPDVLQTLERALGPEEFFR